MRYVDANELPRVTDSPSVPANRTLAHAEAEGLLILTHTADPPTDADWDGWLQALGRYLPRTPAPRLLVVSKGGAPSPKQRRAADAVSAPHYRTMKVAIVSGSTFVRGVVAAFRVLLPFYRAYAPHEIGIALDYLDLPPDRARQVVSRLEALS
jgi:hypothetical protein